MCFFMLSHSIFKKGLFLKKATIAPDRYAQKGAPYAPQFV